MKNLKGRSAVLDVRAIDSTAKEYNVEIQRMDRGAGAKRARHNSSLLDAHILRPGEDTDKMPDSYVIFITENDVMGKGKAVYHIRRYVEADGGMELFDDGSHIVYVNGQYRGDDEVGRLMHDFSCANPNDMNYEALAKRARYFKEDEKGRGVMCKMMEDMRNETALRSAKGIAVRMIKAGKMSLEDIAGYTELPFETIKELESQAMQLA